MTKLPTIQTVQLADTGEEVIISVYSDVPAMAMGDKIEPMSQAISDPPAEEFKEGEL